MPISIVTAGVRLAVSKVSVLSGSLRAVRSLKAMSGNTLRSVTGFTTSPISLAAYPSDVSGFESGKTPRRVISSSTTAVVSGGSAPYSYSWAIIAIDFGSVSIGSPNFATTNFSAQLYQASVNATARCTVTDATGATAICDVGIYLAHDGDLN